MHDQSGKLLVTETRSRNRLYKVRMGLKSQVSSHPSLHLTRTSESSKWHARLGHVNLETMRSMIQRELVVGVPSISIKSEVCGSCLKGKQARRTFPQATQYRASRRLQPIHGDLCGPISPSTQCNTPEPS